MGRFDALPYCEVCGSAAARIINSPTLLDSELAAARDGLVVWVSHANCTSLPTSACTKCNSHWLDANELSSQYRALQIPKEDCVIQEDWEQAKEILGRQRQIALKLNQLLEDLLAS